MSIPAVFQRNGREVFRKNLPSADRIDYLFVLEPNAQQWPDESDGGRQPEVFAEQYVLTDFKCPACQCAIYSSTNFHQLHNWLLSKGVPMEDLDKYVDTQDSSASE